MDDIDLKSLVRSQTCFTPLTDEELEKLASLLTEKKVKAGETIVIEGDLVDSVYFIAEGIADVQHITIKNHIPQIESVATLTKGNAIGLNETGFYSLTGKRTATVVAKTDMLLYRLSMAEFHGFALTYSHVNEVMHRNAENIFGDKTQ